MIGPLAAGIPFPGMERLAAGAVVGLDWRVAWGLFSAGDARTCAQTRRGSFYRNGRCGTNDRITDLGPLWPHRISPASRHVLESAGGGPAVNSCQVPAAQIERSTIVTIEGISSQARSGTLQQAFLACGGAQCGICTPGMIIAAVCLLQEAPRPSEEQIRVGLSGSLCRCTGYMKIIDAVLRAASVSSKTSGNPL